MTSPDRDSTAVTGSPEETQSSASRQAKTRKQLPLWQESILLFGVALVLAIVIKAFFIQAFYIPSPSMEPGFVHNDRILVQKVSYWGGGTPQRGDIVVFKDPGGWLTDAANEAPNALASLMTKIGLYPAGGHLVKRVIGVEGDVIKCCDKQGRISVNGVALDESDYVKDDPSAPCNGPMTSTCKWTAGPVPPGHIFVMGDNRNRSADSTVHMCASDATDCVPDEFVPTDLVVGKVFLLLWPRDRFRLIERPDVLADVPDAS